MCEDETTVASSCLVAIDFTTAPADGLAALNAIRAAPDGRRLRYCACDTVAPDEAKERIQSAYEHGVNGHISGASDIETYADAIQEFAAFWFSQVSLPPQSLYSDSATISYD